MKDHKGTILRSTGARPWLVLLIAAATTAAMTTAVRAADLDANQQKLLSSAQTKLKHLQSNLKLAQDSAGKGTATVSRSGGPEQPISCRSPSDEGLDVLGSRSHGRRKELEAFLGGKQIRSIEPCGSALKFGLLAEGRADLYPPIGPTCEWDTAAGHAVLLAAGGHVETIDGGPLKYGKSPEYLNPGFVAKGRF